MAKVFSVASWNVEHFKNNPQRVDLVVDFLKQHDPDVFALYEVEGSHVYLDLVAKMPDYQFHITEGLQTQEILVGARRNLTAFFTQKLEFKTGNTFLRPGALLTIRIDGEDYPILFLHTKSGDTPLGLGIRDEMFERAVSFKKVLDKVSGGPGKSNFIFLGDLNTMGMKYPFEKGIVADFELQKLDGAVGKLQMRRLAKSKPASWWNGSGGLPPSNLDHVIASDHLTFKKFGNAEIDVRGWPEKATDPEKTEWIRTYSDHALLFFQVEK